MNKKGQLSYEYLIVVGMFLVLAVPFFYTFTLSMVGEIGEQSNEDALVRLAEGVQTVTHLGGPTTTIVKTVRTTAPATTSNVEGTGRITLELPGTPAAQHPAVETVGTRLYSGKSLLGRGGLYHAPITQSLREGSIAIGAEPTIVALCPIIGVDEIYDSTACTDDPTVPLEGVGPSDAVRIVGVRLRGLEGEDPKIGLFDTRDTVSACGTDSQQCVTHADCPGDRMCFVDSCTCSQADGQISDSPLLLEGQEDYIIDVKGSNTGAHTYMIAVDVPGIGQSDNWLIDFQPGGGDDDD